MKRLLKVTAMSSLLTIVRMAMGFLIVKVVAIYTGPSGLAILGQIQSIVASLNGIISAPISSGVVRYTAENYKNSYERCSIWWRASVQWVFIIALLIIPIVVFYSAEFSKYLFVFKKKSN